MLSEANSRSLDLYPIATRLGRGGLLEELVMSRQVVGLDGMSSSKGSGKGDSAAGPTSPKFLPIAPPRQLRYEHPDQTSPRFKATASPQTTILAVSTATTIPIFWDWEKNVKPSELVHSTDRIKHAQHIIGDSASTLSQFPPPKKVIAATRTRRLLRSAQASNAQLHNTHNTHKPYPLYHTTLQSHPITTSEEPTHQNTARRVHSANIDILAFRWLIQ
ncbi:hypothetical protein K402DRAFT_69042 [Aulographum hederae CBS 113979]|uniref:Uncharacterized protein n=1 Tax=Aulographum hederae CBS 113979 TaxID=1176131 RepID=A0A6G1HFF1_9PEZI|nr:hypothetical protein K402DRAFT_69042 [Aulographum hederae CBS 113979]